MLRFSQRSLIVAAVSGLVCLGGAKVITQALAAEKDTVTAAAKTLKTSTEEPHRSPKVSAGGLDFVADIPFDWSIAPTDDGVVVPLVLEVTNRTDADIVFNPQGSFQVLLTHATGKGKVELKEAGSASDPGAPLVISKGQTITLRYRATLTRGSQKGKLNVDFVTPTGQHAVNASLEPGEYHLCVTYKRGGEKEKHAPGEWSGAITTEPQLISAYEATQAQAPAPAEQEGRGPLTPPTAPIVKQPDNNAQNKAAMNIAATGIADKFYATNDEIRMVGSSGILLIRSQERLDQLHERCPRLFPTPADIRPAYMNIPASDPLPKVDFTKQSLVLCYSGLEPADILSIQDENLGAVPPHLSYMLQWGVRSTHAARAPKFAHYVYRYIPETTSVEVLLQLQPKLPKGAANVDFSDVIGGSGGGDVVDGLQGKISTTTQTIAPGNDILVAFELHMTALPQRPWQNELPRAKADRAVVTDEDPQFFVTTPDGKTTLRSKAIRQREQGIAPVSNPPHTPVTINAQKPHFLSHSDQAPISLHDLGVSTAAPGKYTITGVFEGIGDGDAQLLYENNNRWGGSIATNSITVTVK